MDSGLVANTTHDVVEMLRRPARTTDDCAVRVSGSAFERAWVNRDPGEAYSADMPSSLLGDFLRARREASTLPHDGAAPRRRRTPGLRREEVATRAGISVDYYTRLEQGRERRPSTQVVTALISALGLGPEEADHLYALAMPSPPRSDSERDTPADHLVLAMHAWSFGPAYIVNRRCDVKVRNHLADEMFAPFAYKDNMLRLLFLDPHVKESWINWGDFVTAIVGGVRAMLGSDVNKPSMKAFLHELCSASEDFDALWHRQNVSLPAVKRKSLQHPTLGSLDLDYELLTAISDPAHMLVVHTVHASQPGPSKP